MSEHSEEQEKQEKNAFLESQWIYKGRIVKLRKDLLKFNERNTHEREVVIHPGAVVIIPVNSEGDLLLIKQWRGAIKQILIELPAGTLEENESVFDCAQRELQEEIGFKANTLLPFGELFSTPGFCTEILYFFIAKDLQESELPKDATEGIDLIQVPLNKALEMIDNHEITDVKTIAGILKYQRVSSN